MADTVTVLQLTEGSYYVRQSSMFANFGAVGVPYEATFFSNSVSAIPPDVARVFKHAKFVLVEISWKIITKEKES